MWWGYGVVGSLAAEEMPLFVLRRWRNEKPHGVTTCYYRRRVCGWRQQDNSCCGINIMSGLFHQYVFNKLEVGWFWIWFRMFRVKSSSLSVCIVSTGVLGVLVDQIEKACVGWYLQRSKSFHTRAVLCSLLVRVVLFDAPYRFTKPFSAGFFSDEVQSISPN